MSIILILPFIAVPSLVLHGFGCFSDRLIYSHECGNVGLLSTCYTIPDFFVNLMMMPFVFYCMGFLVPIIIYTCKVYVYCGDNNINPGTEENIILFFMMSNALAALSGCVGCLIIVLIKDDQDSFGPGFYTTLINSIFFGLVIGKYQDFDNATDFVTQSYGFHSMKSKIHTISIKKASTLIMKEMIKKLQRLDHTNIQQPQARNYGTNSACE